MKWSEIQIPSGTVCEDMVARESMWGSERGKEQTGWKDWMMLSSVNQVDGTAATAGMVSGRLKCQIRANVVKALKCPRYGD